MMHEATGIGGLALGLALVALLVASDAGAGGFARPSIDRDLSVTSDYVDKGVSQTMGEPALQAELGLTFENGFYAAAWASNVDFVGEGDPQDGADWELDLTLGYAFPVSRSVSADLAWIAYRFPGANPGIDYDYAEWIASLNFIERFSVTAGYSNDALGAEEPGWYYEASTEYGLPHDLTVGLSYGRYNLKQAYGASYGYGSLTLSGHTGSVGWAVSYHDTSSQAESLFHAAAVQPRVVLSLSFQF